MNEEVIQPSTETEQSFESPPQVPGFDAVETPVPQEPVIQTPAPQVAQEPVFESPPQVPGFDAVETPAPQVVDSTPVVVDTPPEIPVAVVNTTQAAPEWNFEDLIKQLKETGTPEEKALIYGFEKYLNKMAPGMRVITENGAAEQWGLWKTISSVFNSSNNDFKKLWSIIIHYFKLHKDGAFHDRYVFRFAEYWKWDQTELDTFQRTLNLIKTTANETSIDMVKKKVSLEKTLATGFTENHKQNINSFYN